MNRKRFILIVIGVALAGVLAAVASTTVRGAPQSPPVVDDAAMRSVVVAYDLEQEPVVPAKFYGRQLTIGTCITLLRAHVQRLQEVATDSGIYPVDIGWLYLAGIKRQIYELHGALPVSWDGRIVAWDVVEGGGDRYVVRAAVQTTLHWATWNAAKKRLVRPGSFTYTGVTTGEYTLERVDGTWKVTKLLRNLDGSA